MMLVLTRREGESLQFGDSQQVTATMTVLYVAPTHIRVAVETRGARLEKSMRVADQLNIDGGVVVGLRLIGSNQAKLAVHAPETVVIMRNEIDDRRVAV